VDEASITRYIADTFDGVDVVVASRETGAPEVAWGDTFFSYDPDRDLEPKHRLPFATIVTKDYGDFDRASNLNRPGVFRLNIAVGPERANMGSHDHQYFSRARTNPSQEPRRPIIFWVPGGGQGARQLEIALLHLLESAFH
jgi:hypothetical protein